MKLDLRKIEDLSYLYHELAINMRTARCEYCQTLDDEPLHRLEMCENLVDEITIYLNKEVLSSEECTCLAYNFQRFIRCETDILIDVIDFLNKE